jgi:hypothetical protein
LFYPTEITSDSATITIDGKEIGAMGVAAGHLRPYVLNGKRATTSKPNWRN